MNSVLLQQVGSPSQLLKLPLADCTFSTSMALHTFKLPIKRRYSDFKLFEVIKIPFQFKHSTCTINEDHRYVVSDGGKVAALIDGYGDNCDIGKGNLK